jgi:hypothetical protein
LTTNLVAQRAAVRARSSRAIEHRDRSDEEHPIAVQGPGIDSRRSIYSRITSLSYAFAL